MWRRGSLDSRRPRRSRSSTASRTFLPGRCCVAPCAPDLLQDVGSQDPKRATPVIHYSSFLEPPKRLARALATHAGQSSEVLLGQRKLHLDRAGTHAAAEV